MTCIENDNFLDMLYFLSTIDPELIKDQLQNIYASQDINIKIISELNKNKNKIIFEFLKILIDSDEFYYIPEYIHIIDILNAFGINWSELETIRNSIEVDRK